MDSVVNMRYYKNVENGYILSIGIGNGGTEITAQEYAEINNAIISKPQATETIDYMLKDDLTWEAYEIEQAEPEPTDEEKAEAYDILVGDDE